MALFNQSTLPSASAVYQIADAGGASGDAQMTARAGNSLHAAFQHFNNYANWQFALMEAPTILITAPFTVTGGSATASTTATAGSITVPTSAHGVLVDDFVTCPQIAVAFRVTATASGGTTGQIGFAEAWNQSLVSTAGQSFAITANRDFYDLPTGWKQPYSVRLLGAMYTLRPIGRRHYDRSVTTEFVYAGTPLYYDIFGIGEKGKIRVLRPPAATDRMQLRYYRRMDPTVSPLDIPAQYEQYLIAWAKWHFLTDKADMGERANAWLAFATDGLKQMLKETENQPDADLIFLPGHYSMNVALGPNSVRPYLDEW